MVYYDQLLYTCVNVRFSSFNNYNYYLTYYIVMFYLNLYNKYRVFLFQYYFDSFVEDNFCKEATSK